MSVREPFEQVYGRYFSDIYNFVYAQLLHKERSEDLVSDVFIKAYTHYDSFDPSRASVRTWLTNIARNTIIDEYRKKSGKDQVSLDDEDSNIDPMYEDEYEIFQEDREKEVYKILSKLSDEERELLSMIYFQEMKNDEIAKVLGINAKAVSARHHRLLKKCKEMEAGVDIHSLL